MSTFKDRRMGYFDVSIDFINEKPEMAEQLFTSVVVLDVRHHWDRNAIEYFAISPLFAEVPLGNSAPTYTARFSKSDGFEGFDRD